VLSPRNSRFNFKELRQKTGLSSPDLKEAIGDLRVERPDLQFGKYDKRYWFAERPTWYSNQTDLSDIMPTEGKFGFITDIHLCSIAERKDVLNDAYDNFEREGITTVFCTGDVSDGWTEYRGHINFVRCHGTQTQAKYVIENFPRREGITTYAIGGN
jgi:hypothetical protein